MKDYLWVTLLHESLAGFPFHWKPCLSHVSGFPCLPFSMCSSHTGFMDVSRIYQARSCPRAFALAIFSVWNSPLSGMYLVNCFAFSRSLLKCHFHSEACLSLCTWYCKLCPPILLQQSVAPHSTLSLSRTRTTF